MWGLALSGPGNQQWVGPAEKSIWRAAHLPETQKSKNCGLERKYASQLWETKGRRKKRGGTGRTKCVDVERIGGVVGDGFQPRPTAIWTPRHAPLDGSHWAPPAQSPHVFLLALDTASVAVTVFPGTLVSQLGSLQPVLGSSPGPGPWGIQSREFSRWEPGKQG